MEDRCKEIVIKAEEGITFEASEGTSGDLMKVNVFSKNYMNPPILEGYEHVCGEWHNGFVIERNSDKSQFAWIPVGSLMPDGTLDGKYFTEKFGRRIYRNDKFSNREYNETLEEELLDQLESVKKYGGFYISRYNISKGKDGKPQSVKGVMPWVKISFFDAKKVAASIEDNESVKSHLTFGAEYDSVLAWFIKSKARTLEKIRYDSVEWANYSTEEYSPKQVVETGSSEIWCINNICDYVCNADEWTQEKYGKSRYVIRGGNYDNWVSFPNAYRSHCRPDTYCCSTGFRAVLCIK